MLLTALAGACANVAAQNNAEQALKKNKRGFRIEIEFISLPVVMQSSVDYRFWIVLRGTWRNACDTLCIAVTKHLPVTREMRDRIKRHPHQHTQ